MFYSHPKYWNETQNWGETFFLYVHNFVHNESHLVFRSASSVYPHPAYASREYPTGWVGIDKDDEPSEKDFY